MVVSSSTVRPSHGTVLIYMAYQMGIHPWLESLDLVVTDVSQSKRRKNAHLGGCPVEFLAAVLQSRHPLVSESILCIPWRFADGLLLLLLLFLFRINIKIRASLRHAAATRYPRESDSAFSQRKGGRRRGGEEVRGETFDL